MAFTMTTDQKPDGKNDKETTMNQNDVRIPKEADIMITPKERKDQKYFKLKKRYQRSFKYLKNSGLSPLDIVMGRGGCANNHEGNKEYLDIVKNNAKKYAMLSKKRGKTIFTLELVSQIRNGGRRFVSWDSKSASWHDVCDEKARKKIAQRLREEALKIHEEESKKSSDNSISNSEPLNMDNGFSAVDAGGHIDMSNITDDDFAPQQSGGKSCAFVFEKKFHLLPIEEDNMEIGRYELIPEPTEDMLYPWISLTDHICQTLDLPDERRDMELSYGNEQDKEGIQQNSDMYNTGVSSGSWISSNDDIDSALDIQVDTSDFEEFLSLPC